MSDDSRGLFGLFRRKPKNPSEPADQQPATAEQREMRLRVAEFQSLKVSDVMIPRAEIVAVDIETPFDELLKILADEAHSRLPVYRETLDDPVGLIHIKDVVGDIARQSNETASDGENAPLKRLHRDILFVPPSMSLQDLLLKMQSTRIHLALVVDEYGGTDGLVSLEDLVEEIVGDIEDEHDEDIAMLVRRGRLAWEVDARMEVDDFKEETQLDLAIEDHEVDTLGGVAFALAGRIPLRSEVLRHPSGADIEILEADSRKIQRLIVRSKPVTPETAS
ncbi:hemolysin family protein [Hyphomonas sp. FCG-A18]|uniref:hemolysin family protein n=1 Tax=Hyphomonas sp. FCG-A18 TaxID=3080019 RepID=UPI002B2F3D18|nr:hemolysin family protein [Hyphomonas sp. FCG-A18]